MVHIFVIFHLFFVFTSAGQDISFTEQVFVFLFQISMSGLFYVDMLDACLYGNIPPIIVIPYFFDEFVFILVFYLSICIFLVCSE